jgi:DNA primase
MSEVTEQIKDRLNVADVLGEYLKLEKAGTNYKALCPFHNEKTPSFMVNPEQNFWYCFGCQKGGDIFTFVQEMEGLEFRDALERLADKAGVEIPKFQAYNKEEKSQKQKIYEILETATRFYQVQLEKNSNGKRIAEYLRQRNISGEQMKIFRIGYAPEGWDNLLKFLMGRDYLLKDIAQTGLLVFKEGGSPDNVESYYDRFRNRIMFPVIDVVGRVVGYSARVAPGGDEKNAKYINTPQGLVYDKSQILYGIYQARTEIKKQDFVIITEGNMDVIASFDGGLQNIIAVSGTALTKEHVKVLKRYTNNFKFCFDMDEAGQRATKKSIQTCLEEGIDLEIIILPGAYKDINELTIKEPDNWQGVVADSTPVMKYFFDLVFKQFDVNDAKGKKMIAHELLNIIKDIDDLIEQSYWLKKLSDRISVDEDILTRVLEEAKLKREKEVVSDREEAEEKDSVPEKKDRRSILQERLLGLFGLFFDQLSGEIKNIDESLFDEKYLAFWKKISVNDKSGIEKEMNQFEIGVKYNYDEKDGFIENEINPLEEKEVIRNELEKAQKKELLQKITWDIKKAEEGGDDEASKLLSEEFNRLSREVESK